MLVVKVGSQDCSQDWLSRLAVKIVVKIVVIVSSSASSVSIFGILS